MATPCVKLMNFSHPGERIQQPTLEFRILNDGENGIRELGGVFYNGLSHPHTIAHKSNQMVVASENYSSGDAVVAPHQFSMPASCGVGGDTGWRSRQRSHESHVGISRFDSESTPQSKEPRRWATGLLPDQTLERETRESSPALYHIERVFGVSGAR